MTRFELIQSFADRHGVFVKQYGRSVTLSSIMIDGTPMQVHLIIRENDSYTMVYQHNHALDRDAIEEAWNSMDYLAGRVSMTFGEIPGLWRNRDGRMRIYETFDVDHEECFDVAVISTCRNLYNVRQSLLPQINLYDNDKEEMSLFHEDDYNQPIENTVRGGGFADVAGLDELKSKISDEVLWPLKNRAAAARYRVSAPNGMLLYGPPGCGKTYFARKLAQESGFSFKLVYPSDIGGMIIHETQGKVAKLFEEARESAPCIICFDEIDSMLPRRSATPGVEYLNTEVNEFLVQMNNCGEMGIFVIGTTNNVDLIDPAALRTGRLDYMVEIPMPDKAQRKAIFDVCLKGRPVSSIDTDTLAGMTTGMTASDICFIVNKAALHAARNNEKISTEILKSKIESAHSERRVPTTDTDSDACEIQTSEPIIARKKYMS